MDVGNILSMLFQGGSRAPAWPEPWLDEGTGAIPAASRGLPTAKPRLPNNRIWNLDLSDVRDPQSEGIPPTYLTHLDAGADIPANVLQSIAAPSNEPAPAPEPKMADEGEPPRRRRSLIDTLGGITDALASLDGLPGGYQTTLDAREDRKQRAAAAEQQLVQGQDEAIARQNLLLGNAVRGLQAIQRANPRADVNAAWSVLAQQAGIPSDRAAALGQLFASDPSLVSGMASMLGQSAHFGLQPFYSRDAQGNVRAYQLGQNGEIREVSLDEGEEPVEPISVVDAGNRAVGIGQRSGRQRFEVERGERPDNAANRETRTEIAGADRGSRERIAGETNRTRREIAGETNRTRREIAGETNRTRREIADQRQSGSTLTPTQRGAVSQTLETVPGIRRQLARVSQLERQLGAASGPVGGLVPGNVAGGSAEQFDRARDLLAAQIRTLTRTVGEGSMSDYESRLSQAVLPSRNGTRAGRQESIRNLTALLQEIEARSRRLLAPPRQAQPRSTPRAGGGSIPTLTPEQARGLRPGQRFRTTDGRVLVRQ